MDDSDLILSIQVDNFDEKPKKQKKPSNESNSKSKVESVKSKAFELEKHSSSAKDNNSDHNKTERKRKYIDPKDFTPISTLFEKNPEIPTVPESNTKSRTQDISFSSNALESLSINERLRGNLKQQFQYDSLTQIQTLAIPPILEGEDVMIKSQTGSGKTMCYAIPIVETLSNVNPQIERSHGPYALILLPTRELALQTFNVFQDLCKSAIHIVPGLLVGGEKCKAEKARLRKGVNILIATPGRLAYHLKETSCLNTQKVSFLILDEVDRLLDMGFKSSVIEIVDILNERKSVTIHNERQTILLSATLNPQIQDLAAVTMTNNPMVIDETKTSNVENRIKTCRAETTKTLADYDEESLNITNKNKKQERTNKEIGKLAKDSRDIKEDVNENQEGDTDYVLPSSLDQYFVFIPAKLRLVSLFIFVIAKVFSKQGVKENNKVIVFMPNKNAVDFYYELFLLALKQLFQFANKSDEKVFQLHGDMKQSERFEVYKKFRMEASGVLFCTDLAARGLDINKVSWIVQFSCPLKIEEYLHKVGRTARIGLKGKSLLFLLPSENDYVPLLAKDHIVLDEMKLDDLLKRSIKAIGTDWSKKQQKPTNKDRKKKHQEENGQEVASDLQRFVEETISNEKGYYNKALSAYSSFIQSYSTYPASQKHIFHVRKLHLGHIAKCFGLREAPGVFKSKIVRKKQPEGLEPSIKKRKVMPEDGVFSGPRPGGSKRNKKKKKLRI